MDDSTTRTRLLAALTLSILVLAVAGCGDSPKEATDVTAAAPPTISEGDATATGGDATTTTATTTPEGPPKPKIAPAPPEAGAVSNPVAGLPAPDQIDYAIKGVLASGVPALACEQTATATYVNTTFGSRPGCAKSTVPESAATSVVVTQIDIKGSKASATAKPSGGPSDGETIKVKLVREDGAWKVDSLKSNAPVGP